MSLPSWLKVRAPNMDKLAEMDSTLRKGSLNTVCESAICPNLGECFSRKTATFLIMGNICTRNCRFCAVKKGDVMELDSEEPLRLAEAVSQLELRYVVITSVTRDDLDDGGASHFLACVKAIKKVSPETLIEVLIPDFWGSKDILLTIIGAKPSVVNHNIETVSRLYPLVRSEANYQRSLNVLSTLKQCGASIITKSGLMLGLGEKKSEVIKTMQDLRQANCDLLTIGQYLSPSNNHMPVSRYYTPEEFNYFKEVGMNLGFKYVASAPLVRSSYHAWESFKAAEELTIF